MDDITKLYNAEHDVPKHAKAVGNALEVLDGYAETIGDTTGDYPTVVQDLLSDLMHFCDQNGIEFDPLIGAARLNFEAERPDEDETVCKHCGDAIERQDDGWTHVDLDHPRVYCTYLPDSPRAEPREEPSDAATD